MAAPKRQRQSVEQYTLVKRACGHFRSGTELIRRRLQSGRSVGQLATCQLAPEKPNPRFCHPKKRLLLLLFESIHCCHWIDCLYALQPTIPHLTRSSLHRCLQRHGISRIPDVDGDKPAKKKFKSYPIGYFHIDIAEVRTAEGKLYLFVAIDRTSKFAFVQLVEKAGKMAAAQFLRDLIEALPYSIHAILTDNGIQFTNRKRDTAAFEHIFDRICLENGIEHRLTKINHPWTNGQVERMNRTIKEGGGGKRLIRGINRSRNVKRYHYEDHQKLQNHRNDFINAYNFARRVKTLRGLTPYEFSCKKWTDEPNRFILNPIHQSPGLNN